MATVETKPLGELAEQITVGHVGPMIQEYVDLGIPFLRSQNVKPFRFDPNDIKYISSQFHQKIKKSKLVPGNVVIVRTGNPGTSCVIPTTLPEANCSDLVIVRCGEYLDPHFVSYYVNSITHSHVRHQIVGAIQKHFNVGAAKELPFPDIGKEDQERISSVLVNLDAKIDLNYRINAELQLVAKTLYDYWFVQFDFPDQNGNPYKSSGGALTYDGRLKREIPEGWSVAEVGEVLQRELRIKKIPKSEILKKGKIPVIDQSLKFICGFTNESDSVITPTPKIVFGDHTRILKFINFPFARGADGTQLLTSNSSRLPQHLFYHQLLKFDLSSFGYARHFKFLKDQKVILPSNKLARKYEEVVSSLYIEIRNNIFENQRLAEVRDWLLPMLMNGQVIVR